MKRSRGRPFGEVYPRKAFVFFGGKNMEYQRIENEIFDGGIVKHWREVTQCEKSVTDGWV
jgi:hypothetical protein